VIVIKSISFKLGLLFLIFILLIESMLFFFLYFSVINENVQNEIENLLARGRSHRDVLEKNYDPTTIKHVVLMESEAETTVVLTDEKFNIINYSNAVDPQSLNLIQNSDSVVISREGAIVESDWKTAPYLATINQIEINGKTKGYVFMFLNTDNIRMMIKSLSQQFIIVGIFATVILMVTMLFLSRLITLPLVNMKKVAEELTEGKNNLKLDIERKDELGDLARSITKLSEDLERLKTERNDFLANISHELRTPLTYIKGYANILERDNLKPKERKEYLSIIQEEIKNVIKLVKELFDLAKMDENQFNIVKESVQLSKLLSDVITKFKLAYDEKNILLQLHCAENLNVFVDTIRFGQVISILLDNALKYSNGDTLVTVTAESIKNHIVVKIMDQGEGIPQEEISMIWERLHRIEKSRSRLTGGSGLGLPIAKEIIHKHGGRIEVESTLGKGTTFTIYLKAE
jgi:signal transduction histidine kinase